MYSVAALKAFTAVVSLGLGMGAVAVTVGIQQNPLLFTSSDTRAADVPYVPREIPAMPPPVAAVTIPEVEISAAPQKFDAKEAVKQTTQRFSAAKMVDVPAVKPEAIDPTKDRVIPAPCNDGEYRKLDERQGVRLMCPGQL